MKNKLTDSDLERLEQEVQDEQRKLKASLLKKRLAELRAARLVTDFCTAIIKAGSYQK